MDGHSVDRHSVDGHSSDTGSAHLVELSHGTLHHSTHLAGPTDAVVSLSRAALARLADEPSALDALLADRTVVVHEGRQEAIAELLDLLVTFDLFFPVIEP
ncbi:alkyl sulfatase C-terminal domain-containing protein [Streptacidiphilus rugosus]|uniref:alkyl sulfatase C-terminal domain-containing protein n=1 Tax=Streptacidiphilus rugosus TaxID=405783 RepID=UPI00055D3233|nr:alkyl sulfatase C-terminal domain-containing protein [Streptacidiphilus rugosus]